MMEASSLKKALSWLLLGGLLLVAACATGTITSSPTAPSGPQEQDPEYWPMLQSQRGIGG